MVCLKRRKGDNKKLRKKLRLTEAEYKHFCGSYVRLTPLQHVTSERINLNGFHVRAIDAYKYNFEKFHRQITIDDRILRINLKTNCLNLKITNDLIFSSREKKDALMLSNDELNNKSIIKQENGRQSPNNKVVSFNNTFYISPIPPRTPHPPPQQTPQQSSYENTFKEYLKKMNGSTSSSETKPPENPPPPPQDPPGDPGEVVVAPPPLLEPKIEDENEEEMEVEMLDDEPPRRGRGRPRGSGRLKQYIQRPPPRDPNTPPKRRGWPLGLPRKKFTTYKNVHRPYGEPQAIAPPPQPQQLMGGRRGPGRPRKILAFGFQTIVTDIKSVNLPSELWSAHVSVTSKRAQVCFTRVVQQNKANNLPVECDRSVKFNGTVKYLVRINNRDVALVAAPPIVNSIKEIEVLLNIVNDIQHNDPILEYFNR